MPGYLSKVTISLLIISSAPTGGNFFATVLHEVDNFGIEGYLRDSEQLDLRTSGLAMQHNTIRVDHWMKSLKLILLS